MSCTMKSSPKNMALSSRACQNQGHSPNNDCGVLPALLDTAGRTDSLNLVECLPSLDFGRLTVGMSRRILEGDLACRPVLDFARVEEEAEILLRQRGVAFLGELPLRLGMLRLPTRTVSSHQRFAQRSVTENRLMTDRGYSMIWWMWCHLMTGTAACLTSRPIRARSRITGKDSLSPFPALATTWACRQWHPAQNRDVWTTYIFQLYTVAPGCSADFL